MNEIPPPKLLRQSVHFLTKISTTPAWGEKNVSKDLGKLCVREADLCNGTGRFFNLAVSFTYGSQSWKRRTNIYYAEYKQGFSFPGFVFQHGGCVLHMYVVLLSRDSFFHLNLSLLLEPPQIS